MSCSRQEAASYSPVRAVLFDLDGLMADSEPLAEWAWNQVLARYGYRLDNGTLQEILGLRVVDSARLICQRFSLPLSPQEAAAERDRLFLDAVPVRLRARPGLYALLDALAARGLPLGVATSGHRRYVTLALQTMGVEGCFQVVAAGDEVARGKPAPDVYLLAAGRLGVSPACCLVLEDAPLGVAAACAAGMVCVAVPNRRTALLDFSHACWVFSSLEEVRGALDDLLGLCSATCRATRRPSSTA